MCVYVRVNIEIRCTKSKVMEIERRKKINMDEILGVGCDANARECECSRSSAIGILGMCVCWWYV